MIVDELVSLIRFDMPGSSKTALAGVKKAVSGITDHMKSLGIVTAVTSGIFTAFSVNAAKDAQSLANLSQSTGVAVNEIEALGAMYRQVGGDAKDLAQDAERYMREWQRPLNLERMIELSRSFVGLTKQQAFQTGRALHYTDSQIRLMMMGPVALRKMGAEAIRNNTTSEEGLENLEELQRTWTSVGNLIRPIANDVQGAIAPALTGALQDFSVWIKENKADIISGAEAIGKGLSRAWDMAKEAAKAVKEALGPAWDVLDEFVKKHGGWIEAIEKVTPVIAALAGAAALAGTIGGIAALASGMIGLSGAASGVVALLGPTGLFIAALAAAGVAVYALRRKITDNVNQITKDIERAKAEVESLKVIPASGQPEGVVFSAPETPQDVDAAIAKLKEKKADLPSRWTNAWTGLMDALIPIPGQTGTLDSLIKTYERHGELGRMSEEVDQSIQTILRNASPEQKIWLEEFSNDPAIRAELQSLGWGSKSDIDAEDSGILAFIGNMVKSSLFGAQAETGNTTTSQSQTINQTINVYGNADPEAVGAAAADGLRDIRSVNRAGTYQPVIM